MDESSTQDQPVAAENASPVEQSQSNQQFDGFQKRIDDMTAKFYRMQENLENQVAQKDSMIQDLIATTLQRTQQPSSHTPQVDIDPELQRQMAAYVSPQMQEMQRMMAQMQTQYERQAYQQKLQTVPPEIATAAEKLHSEWKRRNLSGYTLEDAITFAAGQAALNGNFKPQPRDNRGRFNAGADTLTSQSAPPSGNPQKADPDMRGWDAQQRADFYEQKLGDREF